MWAIGRCVERLEWQREIKGFSLLEPISVKMASKRLLFCVVSENQSFICVIVITFLNIFPCNIIAVFILNILVYSFRIFSVLPCLL